MPWMAPEALPDLASGPLLSQCSHECSLLHMNCRKGLIAGPWTCEALSLPAAFVSADSEPGFCSALGSFSEMLPYHLLEMSFLTALMPLGVHITSLLPS